MADALAHTFRRVSQRPTPFHANLLVVAEHVEIWFSKIERDVIARGVFTSVKDLARKLRHYIIGYSANAKPIQWRYSDPTRRKSNRPRLDFISSTETTGTDLVVRSRGPAPLQSSSVSTLATL